MRQLASGLAGPARRDHRRRPDRPRRRRATSSNAGIDFVVLEAGDRIGGERRASGGTSGCSRRGSTSSTRRRGACSTRPAGSEPPADALPTGSELVEKYLAPLAALDRDRRPHPRSASTVAAVTREGMDRTRTAGRAQTPFLLRIRTADGVEELSRPRGDRRLGHLPLARTASAPRGSTRSACPRSPTASVRALPDVLGRERGPVRRPAHHRRRRRALRRQHPARTWPPSPARSPARASPGSSATPPRCASRPRADDELPARASIGGARRRAGRRRARSRSSTASRSSGSRAHAATRRRASSRITGRRGDGLDTIDADRHRERHRLPPEPRHAARDPPRARRHRRGAATARAADRPERALLRHRRAARLRRAHAPRARLLHRRHEELRPRADVPARHRATSRCARSPPGSRATPPRRANVELVLPATGVCSTDLAATTGASAGGSCCG